MKFVHIMDGPPLYTNCFLLIGNEGHAVAIDPAAPAGEFGKVLEENHAILTHIMLTHGHPDHVASVQALRDEYGAKVYIGQADAKQFRLDADAYFSDGGCLTVDDMDFEVLATPGHTPGSVCIRCGDYLFSGDTLFADDIGRTDLPGGSPEEMRKSLKKLLAWVKDNPQILPGHEEFSTMDRERVNNTYLQV